MNKKISKGLYVKEIDGLRALAVIAVIINHINYSVLPSGYLGVDIFFVISGFVITLSLSKKNKSSNFWHFISGFYSKRIKRLIPNLTIYVILISILTCLIVPQNEIILRTGISSLFGISNLYLLRQSTDYFAQTTVLNPFTHTWSLSVEEQFYLFFPIILWFTGFTKNTKNGVKNLLLIIFLLTTISLAFYIYFYNQDLSFAYYLMPTRFWEISLGCLAFLGYRRFKGSNIFKNISSEIILMSIIGVLAIPEKFGLFGTILIVFLTILLLFNIEKSSLSYKILTSKVALYIGSISYSLYLWHWGIISLSKWLGFNNSISNTFILLILIFCLSIISNLFIENKFRYLKEKNIMTILLGISWLLFTSFLIISPFKKLFKLIGEKPNTDNINPNLFISNSNKKQCKQFKYIDNEWTKCELINQDKNSIILLTGDSMSRSLIPLANEFLEKNNYEFISFYQSATLSPPIPFVYRKQSSNIASNKIEKQKSYIQNAIEYIDKENYKNKFIWIFNDMNFYFYGREWQRGEVIFQDKNQKRLKYEEAFDSWLYGLEILVKKANEKDIKVIFFGSLPSIQRGYEVVCAKNSQSNSTKIHKLCKDNVIKRRSSLQGKYKGENLSERIKNLENVNKNFLYFDTAKTFCKDLRNCEIYEKERMFLSDSVHISLLKAIEIYPIIKSKMELLEDKG